MEENIKFYQIRLFGRGFIEVYQNVFAHSLKREGDLIMIHIHYSAIKEPAISSTAVRDTDQIYDIQVIDNPEFEWTGENPRDKQISLYGSEKKIIYDPETDKWNEL